MDSKQSFGGAKLEYVPMSSLRVHPKIQREFKESWGVQLGETWAALKCEPLAAVRAKTNGVSNGVFLVIDGQHRLYGARLHYGNTDQMLPVWVYPDLPLEEQAEVFLGFNDTKAMKSYSKWNVRRIAKEEVVLAVDDLLKEFGLKVAQGEAEGTIRAIAAVETIYTKQGPEILRQTLEILHQAWGTQSDAYDNVVLRGMTFVVQKLSKALEPGKLANKMAKHGKPSRFIGEARQLAKLSGTSVMRAMAEILVNLYNKGRHEGTLLKL
jgi:hypothetical protein